MGQTGAAGESSSGGRGRATSVRGAVGELVREGGPEAIGSPERLADAVRHMADPRGGRNPYYSPEAAALYTFATSSMLEPVANAARKRSGKLLGEAAEQVGASLCGRPGVSRLDACLASSALALGVSDALGIDWDESVRVGLRVGAQDSDETIGRTGDSDGDSFESLLLFVVLLFYLLFKICSISSLSTG